MGDERDDRAQGPRAVRHPPVGRLVRALRLAWAAPASLAGLLLAPFFASRRRVRGALLAAGASWPTRLGWPFRAITLGHVILSIDRLDERTLEHELAHVRQYERLGILMWPAYVLASAWAWAAGRRAYHDNRFERAARASDRDL